MRRKFMGNDAMSFMRILHFNILIQGTIIIHYMLYQYRATQERPPAYGVRGIKTKRKKQSFHAPPQIGKSFLAAVIQSMSIRRTTPDKAGRG